MDHQHRTGLRTRGRAVRGGCRRAGREDRCARHRFNGLYPRPAKAGDEGGDGQPQQYDQHDDGGMCRLKAGPTVPDVGWQALDHGSDGERQPINDGSSDCMTRRLGLGAAV